MSCAARARRRRVRLDGEKIWISNGGIADVYTVFARTGEAPGTRGISAFVVFADTPGLTIAERIETIAPHPLARLRFENCRIPASQLLGSPGEGFKIAMRTLDIFRPSVAAAALGFARRALDEAVAHAKSRKMFGATLADLPTAQSTLGEMATAIDAAALLTCAHRLAARRAEAAGDARGGDGQDDGDRKRAMGDRPGAAAFRRPRRARRRDHRSGSIARSVRCASTKGATEVQKLIIGRELMKNQAR